MYRRTEGELVSGWAGKGGSLHLFSLTALGVVHVRRPRDSLDTGPPGAVEGQVQIDGTLSCLGRVLSPL